MVWNMAFKKRTLLYTGNGAPAQSKKYNKAILLVRSISFACGLATVIIFMILEDMTQTMVFVNGNTPVIFVLALLQLTAVVVSLLVARKRNLAELEIQNYEDKDIQEWLEIPSDNEK